MKFVRSRSTGFIRAKANADRDGCKILLGLLTGRIGGVGGCGDTGDTGLTVDRENASH